MTPVSPTQRLMDRLSALTRDSRYPELAALAQALTQAAVPSALSPPSIGTPS